MFEAHAHSCLVPSKGKFRIADCPTHPDKDKK